MTVVEIGETFIAYADPPAIECRLCGWTSVHRGDVEQRYCGLCHIHHGLLAEARRMVAHGGAHDCYEWRTGRNACALCGRNLIALERNSDQ